MIVLSSSWKETYTPRAHIGFWLVFVVEMRATMVLEKSRRISQTHQTILLEELEFDSVQDDATTEASVTFVSRNELQQ
jgi:hypothetical protein